MIKKILILFVSIVLLASVVSAETIYLKDGNVVEGEVIQRSSYYVVVKDERGRPKKFFLDQVEKIVEEQEEETAELFIDASQFEDISEEKVKLILRFIEVNGTRGNMRENLNLIIEQAPEERRLELENLFDINVLIENFIPIYDKYYQEEELREIIKFYESPAGLKFMEVTPQIMAEALQVSVKYFQEKANP